MRTILASLLIASTLTLGCVSTVPFDPEQPVDITPALFGGGSYTQDGKLISLGSLRKELKNNEDANKHIKRATAWMVPGFLFSAVGGGMMGWAAGEATAPNKSLDGALVGAGAGVAVVGVSMGAMADREIKKAVEVHNATFAPEEEPAPVGEDAAGDNAEGADSTPEAQSNTHPRVVQERRLRFRPVITADEKGGMAGAHFVF